MRAFSLAAALLLLGAAALPAQRNEVTLEASIFRGTIGYARQVGSGVFLGLEGGFGFPQIDRTLEPAEDGLTGEPDFEEYLHVAGFVRWQAGAHFELDTGVRASVVDVWPCGSSDCWPVLFGGGYAQPMLGWRRLKFGVRLTGGWALEGEPGTGEDGTFVVGLNPFIVRGTLAW